MREIYLKPFEAGNKEFRRHKHWSDGCVQLCWNNMGWAQANRLMTEVLRDEWGFRGAAITDYFGGYGYQNADARSACRN